jgi:hypothetical protein
MHVQKPSPPEPVVKSAADTAPEMRAAPLAGAPLRYHVRLGYHACTFYVSQADHYRSCLV